MRRAVLVVLAPLAIVAATAGTAVGGRLTDPCAVVSTAAVNAAFGASADNQEFGTPGVSTSHGVTLQTCTWTYGNAQIVVSVGRKGYVPQTPAGTTTRPAKGFPAGAHLLVNKRQGSAFTAVLFTKGARFGEV